MANSLFVGRISSFFDRGEVRDSGYISSSIANELIYFGRQDAHPDCKIRNIERIVQGGSIVVFEMESDEKYIVPWAKNVRFLEECNVEDIRKIDNLPSMFGAIRWSELDIESTIECLILCSSENRSRLFFNNSQIWNLYSRVAETISAIELENLFSYGYWFSSDQIGYLSRVLKDSNARMTLGTIIKHQEEIMQEELARQEEERCMEQQAWEDFVEDQIEAEQQAWEDFAVEQIKAEQQAWEEFVADQVVSEQQAWEEFVTSQTGYEPIRQPEKSENKPIEKQDANMNLLTDGLTRYIFNYVKKDYLLGRSVSDIEITKALWKYKDTNDNRAYQTFTKYLKRAILAIAKNRQARKIGLAAAPRSSPLKMKNVARSIRQIIAELDKDYSCKVEFVDLADMLYRNVIGESTHTSGARKSVGYHLSTISCNPLTQKDLDLIIVIDDITTQGNTLLACKMVIRNAYPNIPVECLAVAKTSGNDENNSKIVWENSVPKKWMPFFSNSRKYKALILDLDQTLIDSSIAEPYRGRNWEMAFKLVPSFKEFAGMKEVFKIIRDLGIPVCIVTNSTKKYVEAVADYFDIPYKHIVDYQATRDPQTGRGRPKPDPVSMQIAMKLLNVSPTEVISVGDSTKDLFASRNAGIHTFWGCTWGISNKDIFEDSKCIVLSEADEMKELVIREFNDGTYMLA